MRRRIKVIDLVSLGIGQIVLLVERMSLVLPHRHMATTDASTVVLRAIGARMLLECSP